MRTLAPILVLAASLLCSCASTEESSEESSPKLEAITTGVKEGGQKVASATARGAVAVGEGVGVAYHGVTNGFAEPAGDDYGPYPRDYVNLIRKHMIRWEGLKPTASITFGKPVKSYLNQGLLRGGEVEWQGWVVDLTVESTSFGQPDVDEYVVRLRDDEVIEAIEKKHAGAFRRVTDGAPPAPAAPQR